MSNSPPHLVAVIDDDPTVAHVLRGMLDRSRFTVISATTGASGLDLIRARRPHVVLLDAILPDAYGADVLRHILEVDPLAPVLFVQSRTSGPATIEAAKYGAFDFLAKPLDPEKVRNAIARAVSFRDQHIDRAEFQSDESPDVGSISELVGCSPVMLDVFRAIGRFAETVSPVLILGEPGVGKESVAQQIHLHADSRTGRFLTLHCPAYDERRLQAALFGGRDEPAGLWAQAADGTLMLQEIRTMPLAVQTELLGHLQTSHESHEDALSSPRIIASDSVGLKTSVDGGGFRPDLYFLLTACEIYIPPLCERREDIPEIASRFAAQLRQDDNGGAVARVSAEAIDLLLEQPWPGNLDELQALLRRAFVEAPGLMLDVETLRLALRPRVEPQAPAVSEGESDWFLTNWRRFVDERLAAGTDELYSECLAEAERKLLTRLLEHTRGNQAKASRMLGISRASLRKEIRALGVLEPQRSEVPEMK
ncbi:MAG: sigma-54-dependent Fis family transcriptional regulator [Planctomycetales bacterium]|nr:sigma-54-dependent Fis family transcriptional regulator [Planctomycetales bacterium]